MELKSLLSERKGALWCVYVSASAESNFHIGRTQGIWGGEKEDGYTDIQAGDTIFFVFSITSSQAPPPKGFPRVPLQQFIGTARTAVIGTITQGFFEDTAQVWPGPREFPYRFKFNEEAAWEYFSIDSTSIGDDVRDAVRKSATGAGRPFRVSDRVRTPRRFWVEKTIVANRSDRLVGEHGLGKAMWSPQKAANGSEYYKAMREIRPNDVVLHFADNRHFVGVSLASAEADPSFVGLAGTDWAGRDAYRIELSDFHDLNPPLDRDDFLGRSELRPQLIRILDNHKSLFFNRNFELNQGFYVTEAPIELVKLLNGAYREKTGRSLPFMDDMDIASNEGTDEKTSFERLSAAERLYADILSFGFVFEPWHLATYLAAVRTKPFVILAGVSGTGKSQLPALVARATGATSFLTPVKPDWTDSSELLGFSNLDGKFQPGCLLEAAKKASTDSQRSFFFLLDEMNLARVEHYFAEVLSEMENRSRVAGTTIFRSDALLKNLNGNDKAGWGSVFLPSNLALIGTVNMDESTHGFSKKVLDRAFILELSDIDLGFQMGSQSTLRIGSTWPSIAWQPRALRISDGTEWSEKEQLIVSKTIETLTSINKFLSGAQLQVGYRTRDEVALFLIHSDEIAPLFRDRTGATIDPMDLALTMKILPRIVGGSNALRRTLRSLLGWAYDGRSSTADADATAVLEKWEGVDRPASISEAKFPRTAARLCLMWDRILNEGYTSYWL